MKNKLLTRLNRELFSRVFIDKGNNDNIIYIAGGGRGGTTWIANILGTLFNYRVIFEPFWHLHLKRYGIEDFYHHRYINQEDAVKYADDYQFVLSGRYKKYSTNRNYKYRYDGRVIKDICSNTFLPSLRALYPQMPIIIIVRNPGAVTVSRLKKKQWTAEWGRHAHIFYSQDKFVNEILDGKKLHPKSELEDHIISYCLENMVPAMKMKADKDYLFVSYEKLVLKTDLELQRIEAYINTTAGIKVNSTGLTKVGDAISERVLTTKSQSAIQNLNSWRDVLSQDEINTVDNIIEYFQLLDFFKATYNTPHP